MLVVLSEMGEIINAMSIARSGFFEVDTFIAPQGLWLIPDTNEYLFAGKANGTMT